jgi:hypothetical protein
MEKVFNFVKYKEVKYELNPEGYYQKLPSKTQFQKLPFELKVEQSVKPFLREQGANEVITGRFKNKKREFFTGLIPSEPRFYMGNDYENVKGEKKLSLIVFEFSECQKYLTANYFNGFYKDPREARIKFVSEFISHLNS